MLKMLKLILKKRLQRKVVPQNIELGMLNTNVDHDICFLIVKKTENLFSATIQLLTVF